jgi:hypothetical protein
VGETVVRAAAGEGEAEGREVVGREVVAESDPPVMPAAKMLAAREGTTPVGAVAGQVMAAHATPP